MHAARGAEQRTVNTSHPESRALEKSGTPGLRSALRVPPQPHAHPPGHRTAACATCSYTYFLTYLLTKPRGAPCSDAGPAQTPIPTLAPQRHIPRTCACVRLRLAPPSRAHVLAVHCQVVLKRGVQQRVGGGLARRIARDKRARRGQPALPAGRAKRGRAPRAVRGRGRRRALLQPPAEAEAAEGPVAVTPVVVAAAAPPLARAGRSRPARRCRGRGF